MGSINEAEVRKLAEDVLREHIEHCAQVWDKDGLQNLATELVKACPTHILLRLASQAMAANIERSRRVREELDLSTERHPIPGKDF